MFSNKILSIAIYIVKGSFVLWSILLVILIGALIYWHINPSAYGIVDVSSNFSAGYTTKFKLCLDGTLCRESAIYLSQLSRGMVYWLFFRAIALFLLTVPVIIIFIQVLRSMQSIHTFYEGNIASFRKMAFYGFLITLFSFFNFSSFDGQLNFHFTIPFGAILFTISCLVLAEVFKEGKALVEDKNLII